MSWRCQIIHTLLSREGRRCHHEARISRIKLPYFLATSIPKVRTWPRGINRRYILISVLWTEIKLVWKRIKEYLDFHSFYCGQYITLCKTVTWILSMHFMVTHVNSWLMCLSLIETLKLHLRMFVFNPAAPADPHIIWS